jgi:hypothetical protein
MAPVSSKDLRFLNRSLNPPHREFQSLTAGNTTYYYIGGLFYSASLIDDLLDIHEKNLYLEYSIYRPIAIK